MDCNSRGCACIPLPHCSVPLAASPHPEQPWDGTREPAVSSLEAAVVAGLSQCRNPMSPSWAHLPTPAVALLTAHTDARPGGRASASHNPMPDNGIKFFARGGHKLDDSPEPPSKRACANPGNGQRGPDVGRVITRHGGRFGGCFPPAQHIAPREHRSRGWEVVAGLRQRRRHRPVGPGGTSPGGCRS